MTTLKAMQIAYAKLQQWEGCKLKPYEDAGSWAVGYGHQIPAKDKAVQITREQALVFLSDDIAKAANSMLLRLGNSTVSAMAVEQQAAILCFVYNVGGTAFKDSTLAICLAKRDFNLVPEQFFRWTKDGPGGNVVPGLLTRRYNEAMLFLS